MSEDKNALKNTVNATPKQIVDKNYVAELKSLKLEDENIRKYGFTF